MVTRTIAIDCGKYATKVAIDKGDGAVETTKFRTRITPGRDTGKDISDMGGGKTSFTVKYNGTEFIVGDQGMAWDRNSSKKTDIHKLATYTAIANAVGNGDGVNLAIGCPLSVYINKEQRNAYRDFIAPRGKQVDITVDGKHTNFVFKKVMVFPESSGVIYLDEDRYRDRIVGVVDIGGWNANCCIYYNMAPRVDGDNVFTLDKGSEVFVPHLMQELEEQFETKIGDGFMEQVMKDGFIRKAPEESKRVIKQAKEAHVKAIYQECQRHGWATENMDIVFIGGTSIYLADEIKEIFPTAVTEYLDQDGDFVNVNGFLKALARTVRA